MNYYAKLLQQPKTEYLNSLGSGYYADLLREKYNDFPDHDGRPGQVGGSLPRGESGADNPKIFTNGQSANKFFYSNKNYKKWADSLSKDEEFVLSEYTDGKYEEINEQLRSGNIDKGIQEYVDILDGMIERFNLEQPIQVYRAVPIDIVENIEDVYINKGFTSTSVDKNAVSSEKLAFLIINIPAGKGRGAYINNYSVHQNDEYEFLIKRNTSFNVIDKYTENGRFILELEMDITSFS